MSAETLIRMPKLADTLVEGTLGRWLKLVGDSVGQGEPLASIETDKVTADLTSPAAGTLLELMVAEGQTVAIDTPIARIGSDVDVPAPTKTTPARTKTTPIAARLLAEHGLTADEVAGTSGRLTKRDVLTFVESRRAPPQTPREIAPLTPMRRAIADHMVKAKQSIPHGQTVMATDLSRLVAWREDRKVAFQQSEGANLTFTVFFVYALAQQLAHYNGESADIGVAVALDAGLIVPVLRGGDQLSLGGVARGISDLAGRARANALKLDETQGARMTVTNVGSFGNLLASPIVPLGQLGILGPGLVEQRPLPGPEGSIRPGWRCLLSLVFDRRVFDDLSADRFLAGVVDHLMTIPSS